MPIDFQAIVLGPAMNVFSRAIEVDPLRSQPGAAPYRARGIYSSNQMLVPLENGAMLSDQVTKLGIKNDEFAVLPERGDRITMLDDGRVFWVADRDLDGQGGSYVALRNEPA